MQHDTDSMLKLPTDPRDPLTDVLRDGARRLLAQAIEAEVADWIDQHADRRDDRGHRLVVRNGHLPARQLQTPLGAIEIRQPRVHDRRTDPATGGRIRFTSRILPKYLRRTKTLDELIPWLYLKGVSTGDFAEALTALLGHEPRNLSPKAAA